VRGADSTARSTRLASPTFRTISPNFAIDLYQALIGARRLQLQPALNKAVSEIGVAPIDAELQRLVSPRALNHVGSLGLRGERVFPVPAVIQHCSPLIGYYRMLLGLSRKEFSQSARLGYSAWLNAEESGKLSPRLIPLLDQFCASLITPLEALVDAMGAFNDRDLSDITLLTLGPTLQGGRNNVIGNRAALQMFAAMRGLVEPWITFESDRLIRFRIPAGDEYDCAAASDPDVHIDARVGDSLTPLLAIEIKGGTDASNAHNRAGEAEKSQIKSRQAGYEHCWTVIVMRAVSRATIQRETPSSTLLFEASDVLEQRGTDWERFKLKLRKLLGM
jgi:XcyI restriction endonuclease